MSKASQRFTKTATPNRSVTRRSQPSRKSIKQLSEKDLDLGANPLTRQNKRKKPRKVYDSQFETRSLSLASEKVQKSVKALGQSYLGLVQRNQANLHQSKSSRSSKNLKFDQSGARNDLMINLIFDNNKFKPPKSPMNDLKK